MADNIRFGVSMREDRLKAIDNAMKKADAQSRSEFISKAVDYYLAFMNSKEVDSVLTPALESCIRATVQMTEQKLAGMMFKVAVEEEMMMQIVAATNDISKDSLSKLRKVCIDDVKRTNGRISMENILDRQSGLG